MTIKQQSVEVRNHLMQKLREEGRTMEFIGYVFNISKGRVSQIMETVDKSDLTKS